jgi:hypothetical protein
MPTGSPPLSIDEAAAHGHPTEGPLPATKPSRPLLATTQHFLAQIADEIAALETRIETLEQALAQQRSSAKSPLPPPFPTNWQEVPKWCEAAFPGRIAFTHHTKQLICSANPGDLYDNVSRAVFLLAWMAGPPRDDFLNNVPIGKGCPIEGHPSFHNVLTGKRLMLRISYAWPPNRPRIVICRDPRHVEDAIS